jgi:DNA-directed RNA polymerase specialized sigma subunit
MRKEADHMRKVRMPGQWKSPSPNVLSQESTDFGFKKEPTSEITKAKVTPLDDAYQFWTKNQSATNMDQLLRSAGPTIGKALSSFAGGDKSYTGLAKRLAIDAFRTFDVKKGAKLNTHLFIRLQPLQREYTKRSSIVSVPERVQLERFRLEQTEQSMNDELGREPSDDELADRLSMSKKRIAHVRSRSRRQFVEGQMRTPEGEPVLPVADADSSDDVWTEYVHHDLDPIDKKILEWKTGMYGKSMLSTNEIARRLKITASAVSQRASKIAAKLENPVNG